MKQNIGKHKDCAADNIVENINAVSRLCYMYHIYLTQDREKITQSNNYLWLKRYICSL